MVHPRQETIACRPAVPPLRSEALTSLVPSNSAVLVEDRETVIGAQTVERRLPMLCGSGGIRTCPRLAERFSRFAVALVAMPFALQPAVAQERPAPLKISIVQSQFRDVPSALVKLSFHPIQTLVKSETTLDSEFRIAKDMDELARQLAGNQVDLGVFHGVEFAWARQKHKDLRPLVIAVNQDRNLRAHLLVAANSPANRFGELQGQALALAKGTRLHCRLF